MLRIRSAPIEEMDINTLRFALFNYIVAQQNGEDMIVRIEDSDKEKNVEKRDQEILDTLDLFNIKYSQVIYQSQNVRFHSAMALQLLHEKRAFSCFCSDAWLEKKKAEAEAAGEEYRYDDACRNLPAELVIDNTNPFTVRIVRPDAPIVVHDRVRGDMTFSADSVDSFVIMTQQKIPTHTFATAVDDMLSDISLVITDAKEIENAPKEEHIRASLSYDKKIEYAHIPALLCSERVTIKELLKEGYLPEAISNYLISAGNSIEKEIFELEDALEWFDLKSLSLSPAQFDKEILKHINQEHLKNLDAKELSRYVGFADAEVGELARIYLNEGVNTTRELKARIAPIFSERVIPDLFAKNAAILSDVIQKAPYFESYEAFISYTMKESALKEEEFFQALRLLLTNAQEGPELAEIYKHLKNYIGEIVK